MQHTLNLDPRIMILLHQGSRVLIFIKKIKWYRPKCSLGNAFCLKDCKHCIFNYNR